VCISDSTDDTPDWMPSAGFYKKYESQLVGFVNQMIALRNGEADFAKFQSDVQRVTGRPTNVERGSDLFGVRQLTKVADVVRNGLLLFALAVIIGAGVLVGQALVRAVSAGAETGLPTWRAGCDRRIAYGQSWRRRQRRRRRHHDRGRRDRALAAIPDRDHSSLRARRRLARGLGGAGGAALLLVAACSCRPVTAEILVRRSDTGPAATLLAARRAIAAGLRPRPHRVATRRRRRTRPAGDPGAVGLVGAIVGVIGVVGCPTFRNGLSDAVTEPMRSGVVWDYAIGTIEGSARTCSTRSRATTRRGAREASGRAVDVDGTSTPTFGTRTRSPGSIRDPRRSRARERSRAADDDARAGVDVGDTVHVGPERAVQVVGRALLPRHRTRSTTRAPG
jgi:hypothetical protein